MKKIFLPGLIIGAMFAVLFIGANGVSAVAPSVSVDNGIVDGDTVYVYAGFGGSGVVSIGKTTSANGITYDTALPYVGDKILSGVNAGQPRNSQITLTHVGTSAHFTSVEGGSYVMSYSTGDFPCFTSATSPSGCVDDWTTTKPSDASIKAVRVTTGAPMPVGLAYETKAMVANVNPVSDVCDVELKEGFFELNDKRTGGITSYSNQTVRAVRVCGSISGTAWLDSNGNGVRDADEPIVLNANFEIKDKDGNPVLDSSGMAVTGATDGRGQYKVYLPLGEYQVVFNDNATGTAIAQTATLSFSANAPAARAVTADVPFQDSKTLLPPSTGLSVRLIAPLTVAVAGLVAAAMFWVLSGRHKSNA